MKAAKKQKKEDEKKEEKKKQREIHFEAYTKDRNKGNSKATHSNDSDINSQDPPSSSTENLSKLSNPPSNTTSEDVTYADPDDFETFGNLVKSVVQQQRTKTIPPCPDSFMSESTHGSAPLVSEVPASELMNISSAPSTKDIPVVYLDISDDEILTSDAIPTITSPSDPSPQNELVPFQFIPNNIEEYINLFGYDALKRIHELRTSTCPHPVLVKRAWEEFRRWLDTSFQNIAQMAETTKHTEVLAAAERRIQYELEIATRLAARKRAAEEKAALEAAEKVEFLRDQAEIELFMLAREELERAEAGKIAADEAKMAEDKGKASMISDPRVDSLDKSVEEIKADQKKFKEALKQHSDSQKETRSTLDVILQELRKSKP